MYNTTPARLPAWFSILFLGAVTIGLLVVQPGQLASDEPRTTLVLMGTLAGLYTLYLASMRTHIIPFGIIACTIFVISDRRISESSGEAVSRLNQIFFLAIVGLQLLVWPKLNKSSKSGSRWVPIALVTTALTTLIWNVAGQTARNVVADAGQAWKTSNQRILICSFIMLMLGGIMGARLAKPRTRAVWIWLAITMLAPFVGFGIARLYVHVEPDDVLAGARWDCVFSDLIAWMGQADVIESCNEWCWTTPGLVLPLMAIGLWRTVARGYRQKKNGTMPYAWIISVAAYLLLASVLPATSEGYHPIGLIWLGVALSVFAVADLGLLLFEQVALPVPDSKPAPHV